MIESVFDEKTVNVLPDYYFDSPYIKYIPQLVSPLSRRFKNQIIKGIPEEKFVSYTGDLSERIMLLIHWQNYSVYWLEYYKDMINHTARVARDFGNTNEMSWNYPTKPKGYKVKVE